MIITLALGGHECSL